TTNRTRLADYRAALSPKTGLILKVHPSNYRVVGFAESPAAKDLAALAARAEVPFLYDLGSGLLHPLQGVPVDEPAATTALAEGADLVSFSGDKLLGGRRVASRLRRTVVGRGPSRRPPGDSGGPAPAGTAAGVLPGGGGRAAVRPAHGGRG